MDKTSLITPGARPANPNTSTPTRRTVLAVALALPAATIAAGLPTTTQAATVDRATWDRAFAIYEQAKADSAADDALFWPLYRRFEEARKAVPHVTLRPDPYSGIRHPLSTANQDDVAHARRSLRGLVRWDPVPGADEHFALLKELIAADDARMAEIERIDARLGYSAASDRADAVGEAMCDAEAVLIKMPAPDAAALAWKVEILFGEEACGEDGTSPCWCAEFVRAVASDARRLLTREA